MSGTNSFMELLIRAITCRKPERASPSQENLSNNLGSFRYDAATVDLGRSISHESNGNVVTEDDSEDSQATITPMLIVVAIYDYNPTYAEDVQFKKGDRLLILDKSNEDWWLAMHLKTKVKGPIPSCYVAEVESLHCEEWYHGVLYRKEAEKLLRNSAKKIEGMFVIRESERVKGSYALSMTILDSQLNKYLMKHYVINTQAGKYFIIQDRKFDSLQELVNYYSEGPHGLATKLTSPCPKLRPQLWDLSSQTKDNWEVDRSDFVKVKKIAQGSFGEVWLGKWLDNKDVAIKALKPDTMSREAFLQEAAIMKTLRHEKLVLLYAVCSKDDPIWIITEYMPYGSLLTYLRSEEGSHLQMGILLDLALQVAFGMTYLERRQLIHRDLAARNILVGDNNIVKIADFGLARLITEDIYLAQTGTKFPVKWTAPEVFLYNRFSVKSDVWSFGIVLMEIVTHGSTPYIGMNNPEVQANVLAGYRMPKPIDQECPEALYALMLKCWHAKDKERPNFGYLQKSLDDILAQRPISSETEEDVPL